MKEPSKIIEQFQMIFNNVKYVLKAKGLGLSMSMIFVSVLSLEYIYNLDHSSFRFRQVLKVN